MNPPPKVQSLIPKVEPIKITLELDAQGMLHIDAPQDAEKMLKVLGQFLFTLGSHVTFKQNESRIVVPKIPLGRI